MISFGGFVMLQVIQQQQKSNMNDLDSYFTNYLKMIHFLLHKFCYF